MVIITAITPTSCQSVNRRQDQMPVVRVVSGTIGSRTSSSALLISTSCWVSAAAAVAAAASLSMSSDALMPLPVGILRLLAGLRVAPTLCSWTYTD